LRRSRIESGISYGIQFHPEVFHTERGVDVIRNFLVGVCGARQDWSMKNFIAQVVAKSGRQWGGPVILGLSGGVDSSVAAALIHQAIGRQLTCVFVDNGLLRLGEARPWSISTRSISRSICAWLTQPACFCAG